MFGCETVSDWKKGSSLLWRGAYEGKEMAFVKGDILDLQPGKFFSYTTIVWKNIPKHAIFKRHKVGNDSTAP